MLRAFNTSNSVHHVRIDGGYYETILASRGFQVEGGRHAEFENMSVASFTETDVGVFCVVGSTGDATGTGVTNFELVNVKSHDNQVGTNGALLYTRKATRVSMDAVRHVEAYSRLLRADDEHGHIESGTTSGTLDDGGCVVVGRAGCGGVHRLGDGDELALPQP